MSLAAVGDAARRTGRESAHRMHVATGRAKEKTGFNSARRAASSRAAAYASSAEWRRRDGRRDSSA